ncbi:hypothetical protein [Terrarubrum flagellatum]|uniref:hypothetical protein n=1 Tax=Terrirubrum flagellatum TaxID=2895980 RepID=UPI00314502F0
MIEIHAYAIVSADDRIADADGDMPTGLLNDADWRYFQSELDRCDITVLGRISHEAAPNLRNRRRIVMSSRAERLERRDDAWWWNPAAMPWEDVARELLPNGGRVGAPGGQGPFDYFLKRGLTAFHLSRARQVTLPGGRGLFAAVEKGVRAEDVLRDAGFRAGATTAMDEAAGVDLTIWRR